MDFGYRLKSIGAVLSFTLLLLAFVSCNNGGGTGSGSTGPSPQPQPPAWGTPQLIESNNAGAASTPQIAMDDLGNAIAAWYQYDGSSLTPLSIWVNYFNGSVWSSAQLIESNNESANPPQIAMGPTGNAIAIWAQPDGFNSPASIWVNHFNGSIWGTPQLIESDDTGLAGLPQIAMDSSGNAIAVWSQDVAFDERIWANRFNGSTWGSAQLIDSYNFMAWRPQIAMNGPGNAIAVWTQFGSFQYDIWANRFNGSIWGTPQLIESDDTDNARPPQVAMDNAGNAIAVWAQSDGLRYNIWANRFNGSIWGTPQLIESDDTDNADSPQIVMDGAGNAIAVWIQSDGFLDSVWANRFNGSIWGTPQLIESDDSSDAGYPQIAMNSSGNAFAVWNQGSHIRANRFDGSAWGSSQWIGGGILALPQIAIDSAGNAIAVWETNDNIYANRYE